MFQTPEVPAVPVTDVTDQLLAEAYVLDVREDDEWASGHVPGARHIPLGELQARVAEVPADRTVLCVCAVGGRSAKAAHFLGSQGREVLNLDGGMHAWQAAGRPVALD